MATSLVPTFFFPLLISRENILSLIGSYLRKGGLKSNWAARFNFNKIPVLGDESLDITDRLMVIFPVTNDV